MSDEMAAGRSFDWDAFSQRSEERWQAAQPFIETVSGDNGRSRPPTPLQHDKLSPGR